VTGQKKKGEKKKKEKKKRKCPNWDKWVWPDESWTILHFETANVWKNFL